MSSIAIKYTLIDIVVFDHIPFPIFTHTTGITHFLECSALAYDLQSPHVFQFNSHKYYVSRNSTCVHLCTIFYATCLNILIEYRNNNNKLRYKMFSMGNNVIYTINWIHRKPATLCTLEPFLFQVYNYKYLAKL